MRNDCGKPTKNSFLVLLKKNERTFVFPLEMSNVIKKLFLSLLKHILKDGQPWSQPLRLQTKSECLGKVKNITCYSDGFLCTSELSKNF